MSYAYKRFQRQLKAERAEQYMQLLKEKKEITYKSKWDESKKYVESDERCLQLAKYERQNFFNDYVKQLVENVKEQFRKMLMECAYVSKDCATEGPQFDELVKILRTADIRFKRMDAFPEERDALLRDHIAKLRAAAGKKR